MARYRKASVYLKNGQMWRKPGHVILDDIRQRAVQKAQEVAAQTARERAEAQQALDALRAEVATAKARKALRKPA